MFRGIQYRNQYRCIRQSEFWGGLRPTPAGESQEESVHQFCCFEQVFFLQLLILFPDYVYNLYSGDYHINTTGQMYVSQNINSIALLESSSCPTGTSSFTKLIISPASQSNYSAKNCKIQHISANFSKTMLRSPFFFDKLNIFTISCNMRRLHRLTRAHSPLSCAMDK